MTDGYEVPTQDPLGPPLTEVERELCELYMQLKRLSASEDLAPCALMNVKQSMVLMWNACTDLALIGEEPGVD